MEPNIIIKLSISDTSAVAYLDAVERFRAVEAEARRIFPEAHVFGTWEPKARLYDEAAA